MSMVRAATRSILAAGCIAAGAIAITSCQGTAEPRDAAAGFMAETEAPRSYAFHLVDTGEGAKLAYGEANSEVMSLMLECAKGSGEVEVSDVARGSDTLTLTSGGQRSDLTGEVFPAPTAPVLIASANLEDATLAAFRRTGAIEVTNGAVRYAVSASGEERPDVERFFAACEAQA